MASRRGSIRSVTLAAVRKLLDDAAYQEAISLGPAALTHLKTLAAAEDTHLAVKAVHVAGGIGTVQAAPIVAAAASSRRPALKTAAAAAARGLPPVIAEPILRRLLQSKNVSVRKWAIRSVDALEHRELRPVLDRISQNETYSSVRELARVTSEKLAQVKEF
jgi:HEAT repeat protein